MTRMRFLRAGVHLRRWKRRPKVAAALGRVRQGTPYAASGVLNLLLIAGLAAGYTSFVAKGVVNSGPGERVVTVRLFDALPNEPDPVPENLSEEVEEAEEAVIGADTIPEGNAIEEGEDVGEQVGDAAPEEELGEQVTAAQIGVDVPSIALPEVDAGEGRPDGVVGIDCYRVFSGNREQALECAGREILSGWRAELATYGDDWSRFASELGTGRRTIRYGPLRRVVDPQEFGYPSGLEVPKEVQEEYERAIAEVRRRQQIQEFGRPNDVEEEIEAERERDQDAATYNPVSPSGS